MHLDIYTDTIAERWEVGIPQNQNSTSPGKTPDERAELMALRREIAELRGLVQQQAAMIGWLKQDNERQERNHNYLSAHVRDEFARAFLWLDAIACKVLPGAVTLANDLAERIGCSGGMTVPPHRLGRSGKSRTS